MALPSHGPEPGPTFRNPLHHGALADPFVLKFNGRYYAYGTQPHGSALPVLRSCDLVHWEPAGEVQPPPARPGLAHWAPEVAYDNGRFFLYHSTGGAEGEGQQLRVAVGESPTGPFPEDLGVLDPEDPFTIDAHPFCDDDGQWYLYYCHDFLEGERVGTGIVVDRLLDMTTLGGERQTVMRPHAEWHLYERDRRWYDRVWDWYTVEGPSSASTTAATGASTAEGRGRPRTTASARRWPTTRWGPSSRSSGPRPPTCCAPFPVASSVRATVPSLWPRTT